MWNVNVGQTGYSAPFSVSFIVTMWNVNVTELPILSNKELVLS
ncbi:MAG: hypothetical protein ACRCYH_09265 [Clostridium chrysemydis]